MKFSRDAAAIILGAAMLLSLGLIIYVIVLAILGTL